MHFCLTQVLSHNSKPKLLKRNKMGIINIDDELTEKDKCFIIAAQAISSYTNKLLGKPITGIWLPIGQARDPDTADDPVLARNLMKELLSEAKKEHE